MMAGSSAAVRTLVNSADLLAILASKPSGAVELKRTTSAPGRSRSAVFQIRRDVGVGQRESHLGPLDDLAQLPRAGAAASWSPPRRRP